VVIEWIFYLIIEINIKRIFKLLNILYTAEIVISMRAITRMA
jgi:hypothetical protein